MVEGKTAGSPRVGAILRACEDDRAAISALREACAGVVDVPERLLPDLWFALGDPAVLNRILARAEALLGLARAALPAKDGAPGEAFLSALGESFSALRGTLLVRALVARSRPQETTLFGEDVRAAVDWLDAVRPWPSAWNVHRFHPFGAPEVLVGRVFLEGLVLLSLAESGLDQKTEIEALLARVPAGEARYYTDWRGMPPDIDTLGLLLPLASLLESPPRERIETWIALLDENLDEAGIAPTWLERGPAGKTAMLQGPFLGNDCTAVRLALLLGCARYDVRRFQALLRANLRSVMARQKEAIFEGCVHYAPSFARYLFLRLADELATRAPDLAAELGVEVLADALRAQIVRTQRLDGGWGSPQETALALEALALARAAPEAQRWAMKYLSEKQRPDGA